MSGFTLIEKIISQHAKDQHVRPGDIVEMHLDNRLARDFGGANVVKHLEHRGLELADASHTFFTFDCNPAGSDQGYAANQHHCRRFARRSGAGLYDLGSGIGTHLAVEEGMAWPGSTLVSTDSHANIIGAIGAFGQGMGDIDMAAAWSQGKIWFRVPESVIIELKGQPGPAASAKDIALKILATTGASGLLACAAELRGDIVDTLDLDARLTISSLATESGAISFLFSPSDEIMAYCQKQSGRTLQRVEADADARYLRRIEVDIEGLGPMISKPGHPEDALPVSEVSGMPIDSGIIGSCTNARMSDMRAAAEVLKGRKVAPGVVLKIVPTTDSIWKQALKEGLIEIFSHAGALVSSPGCAGCAEGQLGQTGAGEVSLSTGNRNFAGKQGKGQVWLTSPATVATSAIMGALYSVDELDKVPVHNRLLDKEPAPPVVATNETKRDRPEIIEGRAFVIPVDNIDTDMIFHNRHLAITDPVKMAPHAFGNLPGYENFPDWVQAGDILWVGANFGCGSSRQQAVDAFLALGVGVVLARSYGSIYWRNAINGGLAALSCDADPATMGIKTGDRLRVDLRSGEISLADSKTTLQANAMGDVPLQIYRRGGLLATEDKA